MAERTAQLNKDTQALCTTPVLWNTSDTWSSANKSYYYRQGNLVVVSIRTSRCTPNTDTQLLELPIGYRPTKDEGFFGINNAGRFLISEITIFTNGKVMTYSGGAYCTCNCVYYTADTFPYSDL